MSVPTFVGALLLNIGVKNVIEINDSHNLLYGTTANKAGHSLQCRQWLEARIIGTKLECLLKHQEALE